MSRYAAVPAVTSNRERLKLEHRRSAPLAELYPRLSRLRVEFDFDDGTSRPPSIQTYDYFPAARCLFRYPCPCHACDGEFDLCGQVAELVEQGSAALAPHMTLVCSGQRLRTPLERSACPIRAGIRISATWRQGVLP